MLKTGEDCARKPLREPIPRRAVADHQHLGLRSPLSEFGDRRGEGVEALFHHQPPEETDRHVIVGDPVIPSPGKIMPAGIE